MIKLPEGKCPYCGIDQGFLIIVETLAEYVMQLKERSEKFKSFFPEKSLADNITELQKEIETIKNQRMDNKNISRKGWFE